MHAKKAGEKKIKLKDMITNLKVEKSQKQDRVWLASSKHSAKDRGSGSECVECTNVQGLLDYWQFL